MTGLLLTTPPGRCCGDELARVAAEIEAAGGTAHAWPSDLTDAAAVEDLVAGVLAEHGGVDMLVNNAGRSPSTPSSGRSPRCSTSCSRGSRTR